MRSVFSYLVSPNGKRTTGEIDIDGKKLLLNSELQNHEYTNRIGTVLNTPLVGDTIIKPGDDVILHHNVFRRFRDIKGKEKDSKNFIEEDLYIVQPDQIYAYKRNGKWKALDGFCFVKPLKSKNMFSLDKERPLIGIVKHGNDIIENGTLVGFKPGTEYEFIIEGQRLYRVPTNLITIEYEYQGDEEEYNPSWAEGS
jgi:hypothetical protein